MERQSGYAVLAQSVERILGKDEVGSSNLLDSLFKRLFEKCILKRSFLFTEAEGKQRFTKHSCRTHVRLGFVVPFI